MTTTIASTNTAGNHQIRTYCRSNSAVFLKTKEKHGGLSNMAGGFPLEPILITLFSCGYYPFLG